MSILETKQARRTTGTSNNDTFPTLGKVEDMISVENLWDRVTGTPNYLLPYTAADDVGATGARITKGWFTDLDSSKITVDEFEFDGDAMSMTGSLNISTDGTIDITNTTGAFNLTTPGDVTLNADTGMTLTAQGSNMILDVQGGNDLIINHLAEADTLLLMDGTGKVSSSSALPTGAKARDSFTIGVGAAGVDYTLTFDGENSNGVLTWMEDEDELHVQTSKTDTNTDFFVDGNGTGNGVINSDYVKTGAIQNVGTNDLDLLSSSKIDLKCSGNMILEPLGSNLLITSGSAYINSIGFIQFSALNTANGIVRTSGSGQFTTSTDLPDGTTATTQSPGDNTTKLATTAFVEAAVGTVDTWDEVMHNGNTFTVLDTENLSATINQNDVTNNPAALVITNAGTGNDITLPNSTSFKNGDLTIGNKILLSGGIQEIQTTTGVMRFRTTTGHQEFIADGDFDVDVDGDINFDSSGGDVTLLSQSGDILIDGGSSKKVHINNNATDCDTAISGTSEADLFYVDAANNNIGLATSTPDTNFLLDINGRVKISGADLVVEDAIDIGGSHKVNVTTVNAATYDLVGTDYILNVTYTGTGAVTSLTLPTAQTKEGRVIHIKDAAGNAGTNTITIDTGGTEKIDGQDTLVINADYNSASLYSDGSNWFIF